MTTIEQPKIIENAYHDIGFICQNPPDFKTGESRGYTVGRVIGHKKDGKPIIRRETVPDAIGDKIAEVMKARAEKEYGGELVTPSGDPLRDVLSNVKPMQETGDDGISYPGYNPVDASGVMDNVKKKERRQ